MKIGGTTIEGQHEEILVLPRGEQKVVFRARGVSDMSEFIKLCPQPTPPNMMRRINGTMQKVPNMDDPIFKAKLMDWAGQRADWLILKALEPSNIEWDTVKMDDPTTWKNYVNDLLKYFSDMEASRIQMLAGEVNGMNENKLAEARESFFREQQGPQSVPSSQTDGQTDTPSGEPASDPSSRIQALKKQGAGKT